MRNASRKIGTTWRREAYPISPAHSRGPPPILLNESLFVNKLIKILWQTSKEEP